VHDPDLVNKPTASDDSSDVLSAPLGSTLFLLTGCRIAFIDPTPSEVLPLDPVSDPRWLDFSVLFTPGSLVPEVGSSGPLVLYLAILVDMLRESYPEASLIAASVQEISGNTTRNHH
jgi:hypothetical protein